MVAPNWMVIGHDDPAILVHLWAAAAHVWADAADTSFNLPFMNQTTAVASVSLPMVSQVQPPPNKVQELHQDQAHTFAGVVLPKVPQVKSGGKGEMPSAITGLSQRKEASDDVDIEMSAPVATKVDKGKGRLIKVDLAAEHDHVPKKRKIKNVSGKTSGPKSSMKKREIMSAEPDKGSVTTMASRSMPGTSWVELVVIRTASQPLALLADSSQVESSTHATSMENIHVLRAVTHGTLNRLRPLPRHMSTSLAAPAIPVLQDTPYRPSADDPCQGCVEKEIECITRFSRRTGLVLMSCKHCMQKKVACWSSAKGRPTPACRTAQRAKSQARSRHVSLVMLKAEEDSPDLRASPVIDMSLDNESPDIEPLASPMSIMVDNEDMSGPSRATSRALSGVQPARVECPEPVPGWSTGLTHQGSPIDHGLLPSKQIYIRDSGSPAVLSMIDSVVRMHEGLWRQVVQAHPSFPLPDITVPDATSPQPASTTPDVIYAGSWETFTDPEVTPAIVASATSIAPIASSSWVSPGNIPLLPSRSSSDVIMKALPITATSPQRSPVVRAATNVEVTLAIVERADRPAVCADELPGCHVNIGYLSGPRSTNDIIKASSLTPKSNHLSTSVEVGLAILARAKAASTPPPSLAHLPPMPSGTPPQ
ncbi:hypothetical protein M405DRAFT_868527 [Rhizopogon salebrosus TDB-379]|nr:hypothetical protein M405DRAFT_868527 [Rhizopogon salebrosus TDB-379]